MRTQPARKFTPLLFALAALAGVAASAPFIFDEGTGPLGHTSVHGEVVTLYGHGPYRHMPADVAIQGLAQDLVALVLGVPLLIACLIWARTGSQQATSLSRAW